MKYNVFQDNKLLDKLNKKEWKLYNLLDIFEDDTKNATKIKKENYLKYGEYPIIDQGQSVIAGYSNNQNGIYDNYPIIIFGDHTRIIKYVEYKIFIGADGVKLLRSIVSREQLNVKYVYYFLRTIELPRNGYSRHFKYLKEVIIPLPKISIQNKIVEALDKAEELINKKKIQIKNLDKLVKSKFIEMFGDPVSNPKKWNKNKLDEVVTNDCTISYGIVQTGEEQKEGIPVIRPIDIVNNKQPILEELKKTTQEISNKHKKTILRGNELLITVRANIGDVCLIDNQFKGCNVGRGITPIRLKEDLINGYFLKHQFKTYGCQRELKTLAKGITLVQLNMEDLRKFKLIVPPIELQNEFADFVKETDKLKFEMEKSLKELENNFNSLMQRAFNGELFNEKQ